jgi:hypothetical protein
VENLKEAVDRAFGTGVSHTVMKCETSKLELSVDVDKVDESISSSGYTYTISMGTGFTGGKKASVNIETPPLTREEFKVVLAQMQEALKLEPE